MPIRDNAPQTGSVLQITELDMHRSSSLTLSFTIGLCFLAGCQSAPHKPVRIESDNVRNLSRSGRLYISGVPDDEGLQQIKDRRVQTIIDFRLEDQYSEDYPQRVRDLGMDYVAIPMRSDGMTDEQAETFVKVMEARGDETILLQCASANRSGAMYGVWCAVHDGLPTDEAIEQARAAGMKNDELAEDLRQYLDARGQ
jgi:uncharacterized protein (TIGR01244 family)